jgi:hypothetical protein
MGSSQTRAKFTASSFIKPMGQESRLALPLHTYYSPSPLFSGGRGGGVTCKGSYIYDWAVCTKHLC